jgi:small subunit ribosomal protein S12
MDEP